MKLAAVICACDRETTKKNTHLSTKLNQQIGHFIIKMRALMGTGASLSACANVNKKEK